MPKESSIQASIIKNHKAHGWLCVKLIQTTMNGIPDLMLIRHKRVVFVEVKTGKNKSTPLQLYCHKLISEQGLDVFETNNPDFLL